MKNLLILPLICGFILMSCANKKNLTDSSSKMDKLKGTWELNYVSGSRIAFDGLYLDTKPSITLDVMHKKVSGNTGCNNFNGEFMVDNASIHFSDAMAMTRKFCPGEGEQVFMSALKKINKYAVSEDGTLTLIMGDIATMRFTKK